MKKETKIVTLQNRREIFYRVVNSALAGLLVFFGSISTGRVTQAGIQRALITGMVVMITQFYSYWKKEEKEYVNAPNKPKLLNFVGGLV